MTAVVFALLSTLCAVVPGLEQAAWALGPMGVVLGGAGLIRWLRNEATNRDDALIGAGLSYVVVMVLFFRLSVAYLIQVSGQFMTP